LTDSNTNPERFLSDAGSGSGVSGYAGNSAAFWRGEFKDGLFRLIYLKSALKQERSACLRAF
jgi:hypothetical protein